MTKNRIRFGAMTGGRALLPLVVAALASSAMPSQAGTFSDVLPWNMIPIHAALLPDGKVMTFGATPNDEQGGFDYDIWDPARGTGPDAHIRVPNGADFNSFCVGGVLSPFDGKILLAGGVSDEKEVSVDYRGPSMQRGPSLKYPRYYATLTTLPDGRILANGGAPNYGNQADASEISEILTPGAGWAELPGTADSPMRRGDQAATGNPFWYPHVFTIGNNEVFIIAGKYTYVLNYSGTGSVRDVKPFNGTNYGASSTAVMYRPGLVMQIGGGSHGNNTGDGNPGSRVATIFDIRNRDVTTRDTTMAFPRHFPTASVLPNGEVLVVGGSEGNNELVNVAYTAEIYNPERDEWRTDATMKIPRLYHSSALLLKDGRVFVGGGGAPGPVAGRDAEIYTPDYLLDAKGNPAARPAVLSGPLRAQLGQTFQITADKPIRRMTLVKTGTVTHGFNTDQRFFELAFKAKGEGYDVTFPNDAVNATPGLYMLFAFDANGVPSVGKYIRLPSPLGDTGSDQPNDVQATTPVADNGPNGPGGNATTNGREPNGNAETQVAALPPAAPVAMVAAHSKLCLSVKGGSNDDGADLLQEACRPGAAVQTWTWRAANGGYSLVNGQSNKCVDVYGGNKADGTRLVQWNCHGGANQVWTPRGTGGGTALVSKATNKCIDVAGISKAPGAQVWQWSCHGGANQAWNGSKPVQTSPAPTPSTPAPSTPTDTSSGGTWVNCATEGQLCTFDGVRNVRFGANGAYVTRPMGNSAWCDIPTFGNQDPAKGIVKSCQYQATAPAGGPTASADDGWTSCAQEGTLCTFSGIKTVRFGANGAYVTRIMGNSAWCDIPTFGNQDPAKGIVKSCQYKSF